MNLTTEQILNELLEFYSKEDLENQLQKYKKITNIQVNDILVNNFFNEHIKKNSQKIKIKDLFNKYSTKKILINTPDSFQEINDFYIKKEKDIYKIITNNKNSIKCSDDHLIETIDGWKYTKDLNINDSILTINGLDIIKKIEKYKKSIVYDFEVNHNNHRYWGGTGISSHNTGKTYLLLNACKYAQQLGYYVVFCDSENAVDRETVIKFGIDPKKFRYEPVFSVQGFRTFTTNLTETLIQKKRKKLEVPKIFLALDSVGNLPTQKEIDDAISGSDKSDMTRAKVLKSIFRILMARLAELDGIFVFTNHVYVTQGFIPQTIGSGGTGPEYGASITLLLNKAQLKEGETKAGIIVNAKPLKNRFAIPTPTKFHIHYSRGMNPYIGLENFISWENCGIEIGRIINENDLNKFLSKKTLKEDILSKIKNTEFEKDNIKYYFLNIEETKIFGYTKADKIIAVKHLCENLDLYQLFTDKVFTKNVLEQLDNIISKIYCYNESTDNIDDINLILDNESNTEE